MSTGIIWTDETWNPTTGCSKVSAGCLHCYAEREALGRLKGTNGYPGLPWTEANTGTNVVLHPLRLSQVIRWRRSRRIFVNSMSDLFHERVPDVFISSVMAAMQLAPQHTFQVLTKREDRMLDYFEGHGLAERYSDINEAGRNLSDQVGLALNPTQAHGMVESNWPPRNLWLGVSAEDQENYDRRMWALSRIRGIAVRWVSIEPQLGSIDLNPWIASGLECSECSWRGGEPEAVEDRSVEDWFYRCPKCNAECAHTPMDEHLAWVVAGGESGPRARPSNPEEFRELRDQCAEEGIPFFFKQWGEWAPGAGIHAGKKRHIRLSDGQEMTRVGKKRAGRLLDGKLHDKYPEGAA